MNNNHGAHKKVAYHCICHRGGEIYLGKAFVRWIDAAILILGTSFLFIDIKKTLDGQ